MFRAADQSIQGRWSNSSTKVWPGTWSMIWKGPPKTHQFQVLVKPPSTPPVTVDGVMLQEALLPRWILKALVTIILIIAYATFVLATLRSLGVLGVVTWFLFFSALVWLMVNIGIIQSLSVRTVVTLALIVSANVFAVGVSWSYIRLRLSGQADTNNVTIIR